MEHPLIANEYDFFGSLDRFEKQTPSFRKKDLPEERKDDWISVRQIVNLKETDELSEAFIRSLLIYCQTYSLKLDRLGWRIRSPPPTLPVERHLQILLSLSELYFSCLWIGQPECLVALPQREHQEINVQILPVQSGPNSRVFIFVQARAGIYNQILEDFTYSLLREKEANICAVNHLSEVSIRIMQELYPVTSVRQVGTYTLFSSLVLNPLQMKLALYYHKMRYHLPHLDGRIATFAAALTAEACEYEHSIDFSNSDLTISDVSYPMAEEIREIFSHYVEKIRLRKPVFLPTDLETCQKLSNEHKSFFFEGNWYCVFFPLEGQIPNSQGSKEGNPKMIPTLPAPSLSDTRLPMEKWSTVGYSEFSPSFRIESIIRFRELEERYDENLVEFLKSGPWYQIKKFHPQIKPDLSASFVEFYSS